MKKTKGPIERLEAAAAAAAVSREKEMLLAKAESARHAARLDQAKHLMLPAALEAIWKTASVLDNLLASAEWRRLLAALGTLRGTAAPESVSLPSMRISGSPYQKPEVVRATFKGDPHTGGVFNWTIGPTITLERRMFFMEPSRVVFESRTGLEPLLKWLETEPFDPCVTAAVARLCEIVTEGRLIEMLAAG